MLELLLAQVPPLLGVTLTEYPTQPVAAPPKTGNALTLTLPVVAVHPVVLLVKVNVAVPAEIAVTTPELVTVATLVLLLAQVPPVVGDRVVVVPTQMELLPVILTVGKADTVKIIELEHPVVLL
jgi:hypothetical protein